MNDNNYSGEYADIIDLPHYEPKNHKRMPHYNRAASFSPFSALTGYDDAVKEEARLTEKFGDLDEEQKQFLDRKLQYLLGAQLLPCVVNIIYFQPDSRKEGGHYLQHEGLLKKIDTYQCKLVFSDNTMIDIASLYSLEGEIFQMIEE